MFIARTAVAGASVPKLARLSIEYSLTEHCNINCHACAHALPVLPEKFADFASFARDVEALGQIFHSREVRIVDGDAVRLRLLGPPPGLQ
jgi:hypothetical protein